MREFTVIIQRDEEGYYVAEVPELKGCHTQARSLDELMERIKEAIQLCLEGGCKQKCIKLSLLS
jgi:predicted RNase H-like HicB family nuclease